MKDHVSCYLFTQGTSHLHCLNIAKGFSTCLTDPLTMCRQYICEYEYNICLRKLLASHTERFFERSLIQYHLSINKYLG